jgi:chromosome segregation ATPase
MALNDHAEIRLRGEHAREVEKLQGDLAAVKAQLVRVDDALVASEAEVKRLRGSLKQMRTIRDDAEAEVGRLRAENENLASIYEAEVARCRRRFEEIETLRGQLGK